MSSSEDGSDISDSAERKSIKKRKCGKSTEMKVSKTLIKYSQKYLKQWETEEPFKDWLTKRENDEFAFCFVCEVKLSYKEGKIALKKHAQTAKHISRLAVAKEKPSSVTSFFSTTPGDITLRQTEAKLVTLLVKNDIALSIKGNLVLLVKSRSHKNVIEKVRLGKQKIYVFGATRSSTLY